MVMLLALPFNLTSQTVGFILDSPVNDISCETTSITVDLNVEDFTDVNTFDFIINWDPTVLNLNQITNPGVLNGLPNSAQGSSLIFAWVAFQAQQGAIAFTVPDQTILTLEFDVIGNASDDIDLFFTNLSGTQAFTGVTPNASPAFITISDIVDPTITCDVNGSLTVDTGGGTTTQITGAGFTAMDNCDIQFVSYELTNATMGVGTGDVSNNISFNVGTTTVTYTATDWENRTATCSFDVIVTNVTGGNNNLIVDIEDETIDCSNQTVTIDVVADDFIDMLEASFSLDWSAPSLDFVEVVPGSVAFSSGVTFITTSTNSGKLRFAWDDPTNTPLTLADGTVLFSVTYDINSLAGFTLPIGFDQDPAFAPEFIDQLNSPNPIDPADYFLIGGGATIQDTQDPTLSCSNNVSAVSTNGMNATVNGISPFPSDDCGIASTTYTLTNTSTMAVIASGNDDASGFDFPIGTTTVEYITTDHVGNTGSCSFNVTVIDPNSMTIGIDSTDLDCGTDSILIGFPVESFFQVITVQFTVNWNPSQLEYAGVVEDNMPSQSTFGEAQAPNGELTFAWADFANAATFNDGDDLFVVKFYILDNTPGNSYDIVFDVIPTPTTVVTQTSFPNSVPSGNITSLPGNVELFDNTDPTLTCPTDQNVSSQNSVVTGIGPSANDNCGIASITYNLTDAATMNNIGSGNGDVSGFDFPIGTTVVEYEVTDLAGNTATCSFNVTVVDIGALAIEIDSTTVGCDETSVFIGFPVRNFSDVISVQYTVEWNPAQLEFVSVLQDNMPSPATFGNSQIANGLLTFAWADFTTPATFNDGDDLFVVEFNVLNNTGGNSYDIIFGALPTPVGVTTQASFPFPLAANSILLEPGNVTTIDNTPPTITCPGDQNVFSANGTDAIVNGLAPSSSDNCGVASTTFTLTDANTLNNIGSGNDDASGSTFPLGTTIVEYTVTDFDGNSVSCSFNVNVIDGAALIIGIDSATVNCETNTVILGFPVQNFSDVLSTQFTVEWNPADLQFSAIVQDNMPSPATFGQAQIDNGILTFAWADFGNPATFNDGDSLFVVEFNILNNAGGSSIDIVFGNLPTPTSVVTTSTFPFPVPINEIATTSGNVAIFDNIAPTITCPADLTIATANGVDATVTGITPIVVENCGIADTTYTLTDAATMTVIGSGTGDASGTTFPIGITTVEYIVFDESGQSDTCSFNVTVILEPLMIQCPPSITQGNDAGTCGADLPSIPVSILSTVSNVNSVSYTLVDASTNLQLDAGNGFVPATTFIVGTTIITYTVTDVFGDTETCSFVVTINDSEDPIFATTPSDTTVMAGPDCNPSVTWDEPTITDNCDPNVTVTSSIANGSNFSLGTTTVTYTATDESGNISTFSFNVTVVDMEPPVISCPADISVSPSGALSDPNGFLTNLPTTVGCDSVILTFDSPIADDNCLGGTISQIGGLPSGSTFGPGINTIVYEATDMAGNSAICSFTITVTPYAGINLTVTAIPDTVCIGQGTQLFVNAPGGQYSWEGPNGFVSDVQNPVVGVAETGIYFVTITDPASGCTSEDSVEVVTVQGPDLDIMVDSLLCTDGTVDHPLNVDITNGAIVTGWTWVNPSGDTISTEQNTFILGATEADAGIYCVTADGADGCSITFCEEVVITDAVPTPTINSSCPSFICVGDMCNLAILSQPLDVDSLVWSSSTVGNGLPTNVNTNEITISPTQDGIQTYTLTVYSDGCSSSSSFSLQVSSPASVEPDTFEVDFNGSLNNFDVTTNDLIPGTLPGIFTINITSDVSNGTLVNNGDGTFDYTPNQGFFGTDQFIYEICVQCGTGTVCRFAIVTLNTVSQDCLIPTVITPNGDGINDTWRITCANDFQQNELIVFNRWGDEVYRAEPYNNDWQGTYNDQDLPDGTYFFIFKTGPSDNDPTKGTLTITR